MEKIILTFIFVVLPISLILWIDKEHRDDCKKVCHPYESMYVDGGERGDDLCYCKRNEEWKLKKKY